MQLIKSIILFIYGTIKRFYWIIPTLLLDPFDLVERHFNVNYVVPQYLIWIFFALGLFIAMALTYHELRMQKVNLGKTNDKDKLKAIIQIKDVCDNIPPDISEQALIEKFKNEPDFYSNLKNRLIRLFGLRNELILYLNEDIIEFIDTQFKPLYAIQTGRYDFKKEKLEQFAICTIKFKTIIDSEEKRLIKKINKG